MYGKEVHYWHYWFAEKTHCFSVINSYLRKSLSGDLILNFLLSSQFSNGNNYSVKWSICDSGFNRSIVSSYLLQNLWYQYQSFRCINRINCSQFIENKAMSWVIPEHAWACHFVQLLLLQKIIDVARTHGFFCALWKRSFPTI